VFWCSIVVLWFSVLQFFWSSAFNNFEINRYVKSTLLTNSMQKNYCLPISNSNEFCNSTGKAHETKGCTNEKGISYYEKETVH
jgi:hypothetical protein